MVEYLKHENIWLLKTYYEDAETKYYENLAKASVTPLAGEVAKARQLLIESRDSFKENVPSEPTVDLAAVKFFEKKIVEFEKTFSTVLDKLQQLELRVIGIEKSAAAVKPVNAINIDDDDEDLRVDEDNLDLFLTDSEEEDEITTKIREIRIASYKLQKADKVIPLAKSNVVLDIKPWDDETDMEALEVEVRKIKQDGLLFGGSQLVPLAYGIHKLQISCIVEDEKVSIDELQDEIAAIEQYVQSVDVHSFNKI